MYVCKNKIFEILYLEGYSAAYAAILGAVQWSPLGVPHGRGKVAFNAAEQLLRSAGQSSRLTAARTNAGWLIVGAICTLGMLYKDFVNDKEYGLTMSVHVNNIFWF